jgi:hypothetical protein
LPRAQGKLPKLLVPPLGAVVPTNGDRLKVSEEQSMIARFVPAAVWLAVELWIAANPL